MKYSIRTLLVVTTVLSFVLIAVYQNRRVATLESELARHRIAKPMAIQNSTAFQGPTKMHKFGVEFEFVEIVTDHPTSYTHGLKVNSIENDGLAFRAGIFEGDIIVAMAGWKTDRVDALDFVMNAKKNGYNPAETYIVERNGRLHRGSIQW